MPRIGAVFFADEKGAALYVAGRRCGVTLTARLGAAVPRSRCHPILADASAGVRVRRFRKSSRGANGIKFIGADIAAKNFARGPMVKITMHLCLV